MVSRRKLSHLGEFGWLNKLIPRLYWPASLKSRLHIGPGDDAGSLRLTPGRVLVVTTDTLVEGIHFERRWFPPRDLGEKLLAVNISDLAAMGNVTPLAALITVSLPGDTPVETVDKFYKGLLNGAKLWKVGFLGGDTVGSKRLWSVSATVFGEADPREVVTRGGAKQGDLIGVVGPLGLAAAGLDLVRHALRPGTWAAPLVSAFLRPVPQVSAGQVLGRYRLASSLIDASDGLEASVRLIAKASTLGVRLYLDAHVSPTLERWARWRHKNAMEALLRGGEDYALIFTASPRNWARIKKYLPDARPVGEMVAAREGCWAFYKNKRIPLTRYGYAHF